MSRGFMTSWHTMAPGNLKVGDKVKLPTLFGRVDFTITKIEGDRAEAESGQLICFAKREDGGWKFRNCTMNKGMTAVATITDELPELPQTNIGFTKTYK
jgi:hypothetical protein